MIKTLLLNLALLAGTVGYAQQSVGSVPPVLIGPGYGMCGPVAHLVYDCAPGPGYLRITSVNVYGDKHSKQIYIGSRDTCIAQAKVLRATRSQIATTKIVATCSATQNTLQRWMYDQYGRPTSLPYQQYPKMEECLADALAENNVP